MGLEGYSNGVVTPGEKEEGDWEDKEMSAEDAQIYRGLVARANYLAQDRTDISFAVKELCRNMASPKEHNWRTLKRLARYWVDKRRAGGRI